MRAAVVSTLIAALCSGALAQFATCDDEYECVYQASIPPGITFSFDLRPLCELGTTYSTVDATGHNYSFNICGTSAFECVPSWSNIYQTGVAVQYWGPVPDCNATTPNCTDFRGDNVCCTQNCQVLGTGIPNWQLKDPNNPETGGVRLTHIGVPPSDDDPFWCPWNPNTGAMYERQITYDFTCNLTMPIGQATVLGAEENATNPCAYTIYLNSFHGCGCSPVCANKNCGPDGCGGNCGNPDGLCPFGYNCLDDGVCCRPDCHGRECGSDGCGGFCGTPNGQCGINEVCQRAQCVPVVASPSNTPTTPASPSASWSNSPITPSITSSPPPPLYKIQYKDDPGTIAGSFFGGLFAALFVAALGNYLYKKRTGEYKPYSTGVSGGLSSAPYAAAPVSSFTATPTAPSSYGAAQGSSGGYGSL